MAICGYRAADGSQRGMRHCGEVVAGVSRGTMAWVVGELQAVDVRPPRDFRMGPLLFWRTSTTSSNS